MVNEPFVVVTYATPPVVPLTVNLKSLFEPGVTRVHAPEPSCAAIQIGAFDAQKFHATFPLELDAWATANETLTVAFETPVPVPVTVSEYVPGVVEAAVAIVKVDVVPDTLVGLSVAVTPVGAPVTVSATLPANPPARVTVIVDVPDAPCVIELATADAASVNDPVACAAVTASVTVVVAFEAPVPVPVTVSGYEPTAVFAATASVSVDVVPVTLAGLKVAVTPVGAPVTASATAPVNVPVRVTVIVEVPLAPCTALADAGDAASVNPLTGAAVTVSASAAVLSATPALFARTVRFVVPAATDAPTAIDNVLDVAPLARLAGDNVAVTPAGAPSIDRSTAAVKPPPRVIVTVTVLLAPCCTVAVLADSERSSVGVGLFPVGESSPPPPHAASAAARTTVINFRIEISPKSG